MHELFPLGQMIESILLDWSNIPLKHPVTNLDSGHYQGGVTTLGKNWLQYSCSITWWVGLCDFNQKQDYFLCTDPWFQTEETRWWGWFSSHSYLVCTRFEWGTLETAPFQRVQWLHSTIVSFNHLALTIRLEAPWYASMSERNPCGSLSGCIITSHSFNQSRSDFAIWEGLKSTLKKRYLQMPPRSISYF